MFGQADRPRLGSEFDITLYDPDGFRLNQVKASFDTSGVGVLELEALLAGCKLESGLKHCHVVIHCPEGGEVLARLQSREGACLMAEPMTIDGNAKVFLPVTLMKEGVSLLCLINQGEKEANLRVKFFCGSRSPEVVWVVPSYGSRVFEIGREFADYFDASAAEMTQAYVRLGVRGEYSIGAQLIERLPTPNAESIVLNSIS